MLKQTLSKFLPMLLGLALLGPLLFTQKVAVAANPTTINFQGKVVNSNGTNVTDGTYSFVFRIYNMSSPTMTTSCTTTATCLWQETQGSVSVTNGVFQVELGSSCALTSGSCNNSAGGPINFANSNSLYLTMQFNGDTSGANGGFMSPLIHITSVPFAFQADNSSTLGGLAAGNFVQLAQGLQTDASSSNASIAINKTGSTANILTLQKSSANVLLIDNSGLLTLQPAASLTSGQTAFTQTLTNASSTGGTVNGYSQTIMVSNTTSASTTNGFNISLTDNTALANTNNGIKISLAGTNTNQNQLGIDVTTANGFGIRAVSSGGSGGVLNCGGSGFSGVSIGLCADSTYSGGGIGAVGRSSSTGSTSSISTGSGLYGLNTANVTSTNFVKGVTGVTTGTGTAGTAIGVYGQGNQGAGATVYGGYFTLGTGGATAGAALYATNSTVAANILQLQNNNVNALVVNSSGNLVLGQSNTGGANGTVVFDNSAGTGTATITLAGNPTTNYTYQLPTGTVNSNSCLQSGTVSGGNVPLTFSSCGSGGGTFATDYSTTSQASNTVTYSNSGGGALVLQDASTPLSTLFTIENNAATFNYLTVTLATSVPHLRVYGASSSDYADIYYDASTSTAVFGASSGTTQIGTGTGNITFGMTAVGNSETHTHTGSLASTYSSTDYTFTRNLTGTSFALQGNVLSIVDTSTFTSGSSSPNLLYINQNNTSATGKLILAQTGGSNTKFSLDTAGNAILAGSLQVQSASGITAGTASNAGILYLFNGSNTVSIQGASSTSAYGIVLPASAASAANLCLANTTASSGTLQWIHCGGSSSTVKIVLTPEFVGAVMTPVSLTGWTNTGTMTSDFCSGSSRQNINTSICTSATESHNYYAWTASSNCVNYDIWVRWSVPNDFSSFPSSNNNFNAWKTGNATTCNSVSGNDDVKVNVYTDSSASTCASQSMTNTSGSWQNTAINMSGCSPNPGDVLTFDIQLKVNTSGDFANIGEITLNYNRL